MTAAIYDFPAIAKLTKAFAEEPPQNEVKPVEPGPTEDSHVYGYDVQPFPADYSCWREGRLNEHEARCQFAHLIGGAPV